MILWHSVHLGQIRRSTSSNFFSSTLHKTWQFDIHNNTNVQYYMFMHQGFYMTSI